jgi:hypothetical protein
MNSRARPFGPLGRQIDFIRKSAIPLAMVGLLNALPDTQLWKRLQREGRLIGRSFRKQYELLPEFQDANGSGCANSGLSVDHADHILST